MGSWDVIATIVGQLVFVRTGPHGQACLDMGRAIPVLKGAQLQKSGESSSIDPPGSLGIKTFIPIRNHIWRGERLHVSKRVWQKQ